jgi:hypothetical protein
VFSHVYVISANPIIRSTVEDVWQLFSRWKDDTDRLHGYGSELALGVPYWSTNEDAQVLTKSQVNDIVSGQAFIFVAIYIPFQDDLGSHVQDKCFWIQPPATSMSPWHECGEHNTQVDFGK